jgi:hypothetical protein
MKQEAKGKGQGVRGARQGAKCKAERERVDERKGGKGERATRADDSSRERADKSEKTDKRKSTDKK